MSSSPIRNTTKKISLTPKVHNKDNIKQKKKSNSQIKYQNAPDIMTQVKPNYLNNFIQLINPHDSAFTPTNHCNILIDEEILLPPKSKELSNKKTLILDLDETLVHSSFIPFEKNDIVLNVDFEGVLYNIYVLIRPHVEKFLKNIAKFFEIVVFTASISKYASPLLDILDKEKNIKYRLYRDHCTFINGVFVKDLKRLNRSLKDIIIVDNSPIAYAFDSENGLPIKTWVEDPDDNELLKITPILEFLSKTVDVRDYIEKFVEEDEILFEEAMNIIKNFDKKKENNNSFSAKIIIDSKSNSKNNNSFKNNNIKTINIINKSNKGFFSFNQIVGLKNYNTNNNTNKKESLKLFDKRKGNTTISLSDNENNIDDSNNYQSDNKKIIFTQKNDQKNNIFRTNNGLTSTNNINNKYPLYPLNLPFSNTVKNFLSPQIIFSNTMNKMNNKINIVPITLNKNSHKNLNKKYTNLLERFENKKDIKSLYLTNNNNNNKNYINKMNNNVFNIKKRNIICYQNGIINKPSHLRISSSITSYKGLVSINFGKNKNDNESLQVNKSNSIGNVFRNNTLDNKKYFLNQKWEAKTPNRQLAKFQYDNKDKKLYNFNFIKPSNLVGSKCRNICNSAKNNNIYCKRAKTSNRKN